MNINVDKVKESLEATLNSNVISTDSLYGIIILLVVIYIIVRLIRKTLSSPGWLIGFIFLVEIGHILAYSTDLGTWIPVLQSIFKYDVLTALAQLCVGTKVSDVLLSIQAWLTAVIGGSFRMAFAYIKDFFDFLNIKIF